MQEKITFNTQDGVTIVGDWYAPSAPNGKAVLLLHMMPATKESWSGLAQKLQEKGYAALAIDLRGHGESTLQNGKVLNYQNFSDEEHRAKRLDVEASLEFLRQKGYAPEAVLIGGASIGANLALQALAEHPEMNKAFALSPGLNYRGVTTQDKVERLHNVQKIFLAASKEDAKSAETVEALHQIANFKSTLRLYSDNAGHGTAMFAKHPELMDALIIFLES